VKSETEENSNALNKTQWPVVVQSDRLPDYGLLPSMKKEVFATTYTEKSFPFP